MEKVADLSEDPLPTLEVRTHMHYYNFKHNFVTMYFAVKRPHHFGRYIIFLH